MLSGLKYYENPQISLTDPRSNKVKHLHINEKLCFLFLILIRSLKDAFSWGATDMSCMANCLLNICKTVYSIVSKESRLLEILAPCYILGKVFFSRFIN